MKIRYLFAALFVILELPVLLPLAAGALVTGAVRGAAALWTHARQIDLPARSVLRGAPAERVAHLRFGA